MSRRPWGKTKAEVHRLRAEGLTVDQIAARMGCGEVYVRKTLSRCGLTQGRDPRPRLIFRVPPDMLDWLKAETPRGATLGDLVLAILNDARADAQEARK